MAGQVQHVGAVAVAIGLDAQLASNDWATQGLNESIGPLMIHGTMESRNIEAGTDLAVPAHGQLVFESGGSHRAPDKPAAKSKARKAPAKKAPAKKAPAKKAAARKKAS